MKQLQTVIIFFLLCLALVACLAVTPLPQRTRTPQGTEEKSVDLTFIQPGKTTRAEVMDKLKLIDTTPAIASSWAAGVLQAPGAGSS